MPRFNNEVSHAYAVSKCAVRGHRLLGRRGAGPERIQADLQGKVATLSPDGKSLTLELPVTDREKPPERVELKLTAQTKIEFTGIAKDLAKKVKVGDSAAVSLQAGTKDTASRLLVNPAADLSGKITAVAANGMSLTLEVPSRQRGEEPMKIEIKITAQTKKEAAQIQVDNQASVWLEEGTKDKAAAIRVFRARQ